MAIEIRHFTADIDTETGLPDEASYTFTVPLLGEFLGITYKNGQFQFSFVGDWDMGLLNVLGGPRTFVWRSLNQAPPTGSYRGLAIIETVGDTLYWYQA